MTSTRSTSIAQVAQFIVDGGLKEAIGQEEIRNYCLDQLRDFGCKPPINRLVLLACVRAGSPAFAFAIRALGTNLLDFLTRYPLVARLFTRLANLCAEHRRKDELRQHFRAYLEGEEPGRFEVDEGDSYDLTRDALTAQQLAEIEGGITRLGDNLASEIDRAIKELKFDPITLMDQWDENPDVTTISNRIRYDSRQYSFVGRDDEMEVLRWFLGEPVAWTEELAFRWLLLTGVGGIGKTRLAMEFVRHHLPQGWIGRRIPKRELAAILDAAPTWQPSQPTLLVIDYPAEQPEKTRQLLERLARRDGSLLHPVRILLLERDASDNWFNKVLEEAPIPSRAFVWRGERLSRGLPINPIGWDAIASVTVNALAGEGCDTEQLVLLASLMAQVDPQPPVVGPADEFMPGPPRPLFVLAVLEWAKARLAADEPIENALDASEAKREVLGAILRNDRQKFWAPAAGGDDARLAQHENLLALASFGLGLPEHSRIAVRAEEFELNYLFPSMPDRNLLDVMSLVEEGRLAQLEPDLLGEFHVLTRLGELRREHGVEAIARFCELAYCEAGDQAGVFAVRCLRDFPEMVADAGYLAPRSSCNAEALTLYNRILVDFTVLSAPDVASDLHGRFVDATTQGTPEEAGLALAQALKNLAGRLGEKDRWDLLDTLYARQDRLAESFGNCEAVATEEAQALFNLATSLREKDRWDLLDTLHARQDRLAERFDDSEAIAIEEAQALTNLAARLGEKDRWDLLDTLYARQDRLAQRFDDSEAIATEEAQALFNLATDLGEKDRWNLLDTLYARQDRLAQRFDESEVIATEEAQALKNLAARLGEKDRWDLLDTLYARQGRLAQRFDDSEAIATEEAQALKNLAGRLGEKHRWDLLDALHARQDRLAQRFDDSEAIATEEAQALFNLATDLGEKDRWDLLDTLYARQDRLAQRFDDSEAIATEEAQALKNLAGRLGEKDRWDLLDTLYARQDRLAQRFDDSEAIATEEAQALKNLAGRLGEKDRWDLLATLYARQDRLAERFDESEVIATQEAQALTILAGDASVSPEIGLWQNFCDRWRNRLQWIPSFGGAAATEFSFAFLVGNALRIRNGKEVPQSDLVECIASAKQFFATCSEDTDPRQVGTILVMVNFCRRHSETVLVAADLVAALEAGGIDFAQVPDIGAA